MRSSDFITSTEDVGNTAGTVPAVFPSYHPGRTAVIYSGDVKIGAVGQIHPAVVKNYGLSDTYAAELDFLLMLKRAEEEGEYTPLPRLPSIIRDIAIVCDLSATVAEMTECIRKSAGKLLREAKLFDVYAGNQTFSASKRFCFIFCLLSKIVLTYTQRKGL